MFLSSHLLFSVYICSILLFQRTYDDGFFIHIHYYHTPVSFPCFYSYQPIKPMLPHINQC